MVEVFSPRRSSSLVNHGGLWRGWREAEHHKHCNVWRRHGPAEGHREAHCNDPASPYRRSGYNLAYAGKREALDDPR